MPGLTSENALIRFGVAGAIVFGGLYALDSFGLPGMTIVALLVGVGVLIAYDKQTQERERVSAR